MKYIRRNEVITVDKGLTDSNDLFDRLKAGLAKQSFVFLGEVGRNRLLLPKLTLIFGDEAAARRAMKWIKKNFDL